MRAFLARLRGIGRVFRSVFQNGALRRVLLAFAAFGMAELGTWTAILVFAYQRGGAVETGLAAVVQLVPAAVVAPIGAVLGDRLPRQRVLAGGYFVQGVTMAGTGAAIISGAPSALVYTLAAVVASSVTITRPVQGALLPQLARTPEELTAANSAAGTIESAAALVGPAIAGILLALEGPGLVFAGFAAMMLLAAIAVSVLAPQPAADRDVRHPVAEALEGLRVVTREPQQRMLVGLLAARSVIIGALDVMMVVVALSLLGIGQAGAAYLNAALGGGGLLGGLATFVLIGRGRLTPALGTGLLLLGLPVALLGIAPGSVIAVSLLVASGAGYTLADVTGRTLLQRVVPDEVLTRVFGVLEGLDMAALAVGAALASILTELIGAASALAVVGAMLPVVAMLLWRKLRAIDRDAPTYLDEIEVLRSLPLFSPLAAPELEGVAMDLIAVSYERGDDVIVEGDAGDRFYVIRSGSVEVARGGEWVATLEAGDSFGEIALLRDVPRTATVTALEPLELLALERADFLEAVTGHPISREEADAVVEDRLR
jgi:MFS family permease